MRTLLRFLAPALAATATLAAARAQTSPPAAPLDTPAADAAPAAATLEAVEVRAVRASDAAPFARTDFGAAAIRRAANGQDLPYLLQYAPSVVTTSDAGAGIGYTSFRVRGADATRINVTLNGVPVNDAESGGVFFVNFPDLLSSTTSVQLQRGVGTSSNGPGAFGATLSLDNLRTRDSAGAEVILGGGSFGTGRATVRAGTGLLPGGFSVDVRGSVLRSDGYIRRSGAALRAVQLLGGLKASEKTTLRALVMLGRERTAQAWGGVPEDSLKSNRRANELGLKRDGTYYTDQTDNYGQDYYQLHADHRFSSALTAHAALFYTRGQGYYAEYKIGEDLSAYGLPPFITPSGADTFSITDLSRRLWLDNHFYGGVASVLYTRGRTAIIAGGAAAQYLGTHYGDVTWAQYGVPSEYQWYNLDAQKNDFSAYVKAEHRIGRGLVLFGDAQYRTVGYFMNGFRKNPGLRPAVTYHFFNPKGGASYFFRTARGGSHKLYASVAVGHKEPIREDFEAAPGTGPRPERLTDAEVGWEVRGARATAAVNGFYMRYKDALVLTGAVNDVGAYTRVNVPRAYRAGVELQGSVAPARWVTLGANAALSRNKIPDFVETVDDYDDGVANAIPRGTTDIAFSPSVVGAATFTFRPLRDERLEIDLLGKYVGRQYLDNTSAPGRALDPYALADLRLRLNLRTLVAGTESRATLRDAVLQIQVNNFLNRMYESNGYTFSYVYGGTTTTSNYYYPQAGTNVLASLMLGF